MTGCKERYIVGDYVMVEWEGNEYPAMVVGVEGPARYRVHYQDYDEIWDESVSASRIKSRITGKVSPPPPPLKVLRRGGAPVGSQDLDGGIVSRFEKGQIVKVWWHGNLYRATILEVLGDERYRIHYDGFGPEWDETIDISRIKPAK